MRHINYLGVRDNKGDIVGGIKMRLLLANNFIESAAHSVAANGAFMHLFANYYGKARVFTLWVGDILYRYRTRTNSLSIFK